MSYDSEVVEFHRYAPGVPQAPEWGHIVQRYMGFVAASEKDPTKHSTGPNRHTVDLAWIICLLEAGIIQRPAARKLLRSVRDIEAGRAQVAVSDSHGYAERQLIEALNGDEDLASTVNLGRTLQEPMSRLDLRAKTIEMMRELIDLQESVLQTAESNVNTIMPGHTHLSQAQPITYSHYLLSVYDGLERSLEQLELAYSHVNRNSGGCGATSGITLPIDRMRMAALLGMDGIVEPTYDSESGQDHSLSVLFSLSNLAVLLSQCAMDLNIWAMEEYGMFRVDPAWCGVSSMMPQKCIPGTLLERTRIEASYILGQMVQSCMLIKGEPHADMLPMLEPPKIATHAIARAIASVQYYRAVLLNSEPQTARMLDLVRRGFSCASEVAMHLVTKLDYGTRRAHRIVATFVRMARERGLPAYEVDAELLDEAARFAEEREPRMTTQELRNLLDPRAFIATHDQPGGTSPRQQATMIDNRRHKLRQARTRLSAREERLRIAREELNQAVEDVTT